MERGGAHPHALPEMAPVGTPGGLDDRFIPYPALRSHGLIGDRRTAALVAADGTIDWWCVPDFDSAPCLGALLDAREGGGARLGPARLLTGRQRYLDDTPILVTTWDLPDCRLELTDVMVEPEDCRRPGREAVRTVVRRLRCLNGRATCVSWFDQATGRTELNVWSSRAAHQPFALEAGMDAWMVLSAGDRDPPFHPARLEALVEEAAAWWRTSLRGRGSTDQRERAARSQIVLHLLRSAPTGALVAAPMAGLPARESGSRSRDQRFEWIRDASLSVTALALVGNVDEAARLLEWLCGRETDIGSPLHAVCDVGSGNGAAPAALENRAVRRDHVASYGFFADCLGVFLDEGGSWRPEYGRLLARAADHVCRSWRAPDAGIWGLAEHQQFVASKVMAWVTLDRAVSLQHRGLVAASSRWAAARDEIRRVVLERGFSERMGAFRQRYDIDTLDAAALLIPIVGFLPPDDRRVLGTVERIMESLTIDDLVYRFAPRETPGQTGLPLGQLEGAHVPATLWLASALLLAGGHAKAESLLTKIDGYAGDLGLLAEEIDPRHRASTGRYPLVFSHAEHLRLIALLGRSR